MPSSRKYNHAIHWPILKKLQISPKGMEVDPMPIGMTRICKAGAGESFQGRNFSDKNQFGLWLTGAVEFWNGASLSWSCCGPPGVLPNPKVYSYAAPYHDRQTLQLPWRNCDDYTSTFASTPWQLSHTASDQKCRSPIAQDSPTTPRSKQHNLNSGEILSLQ